MEIEYILKLNIIINLLVVRKKELTFKIIIIIIVL